MGKIMLFFKNRNTVSYAVATAIILIVISFICFKTQVNTYIEKDMRSQIEAIQKSSTQLIQNELNYLTRLNASAAQIINRTEIKTDEDILQTLQDHANGSNILRSHFVTLDGHTYTSHAGNLGQKDKEANLDGVALSDIKETVLSQPYYSKDINEVIFGVASPVTMGEKKGVLVSLYNINEFHELLANEFIGGSVEIGILNSKGEVVLGRSTDDFALNTFHSLSRVKFLNSSPDEMQANFAVGASGFSSYYVGGITRYCSYAPIVINDWYVFTVVKEDSLRSNLAQLEKYGFQLTTKLVVIMLFLLLFVTASRYKEQEKMRIILQQAAMIDGLTGIYNRGTVETEINQYLQSADSDTHSALLIIDIDNFKKINDTWGHLLGDVVLKECADRLKDIFESEDIIGRIGGDEFVALVKNCTNIEQIQGKVDHFINHLYVLSATEERVKISVSVGISLTGSDENSFLNLYQRADTALYRAKQTGKGKLSL